jgi:hypothetical protein
MGNSSSNDELSSRVKELTMEILGQFQKEFSFSIRDLIVNECSNNHGYTPANVNRKWKLHQSTQKPTEKLRTGFLDKLGSYIKTWKRRYFVVKNVANNYSIVYYSTSDGIENASERGKIHCEGYQIDSFNDEEEENYGPYGIKLRPYDLSKRIWFLRAETEAVRDEWIETLVNVCKLTAVPLVEDLRCQRAFRDAYQNTRASYGYFLWYKPWGSEIQMVQSAIRQILHREILGIEDYEDDSSNSDRQKRKMDACIIKIVHPLVKSTWDSCVSQTSQMVHVYKMAVNQVMPTITETQERVKAKLAGKISALFQGQLLEMQMLFFEPLMEYCSEAMLDAFLKAMSGFSEELLVEIGFLQSPTVAVSPSEKDAYHANSNRQTRMEHNLECSSPTNPLADSQKLLWKLFVTTLRAEDEDGPASLPRVNNIIGASHCHSNYPDILIYRAPAIAHNDLQFESGRSYSAAKSSGTFCSSGLCGTDLYVTTIEDLRALLRNAIYTFWKLFASENHQREYASNRYTSRQSVDDGMLTTPSGDSPTTDSRSTPQPPLPGDDTPSLAIGSGVSPTVQPVQASAGRLNIIHQDVVKRLVIDAAASLQHAVEQMLLSAVDHRLLEVLLPSCSEIAIKDEELISEEMRNYLSTSSIAEVILRELLHAAVVDQTEVFKTHCAKQLSTLASELVMMDSKLPNMYP